MAKARNQNQNCALCCNPTPTEVYRHLPGFIKLLCNLNDDFESLSTSLSTSAGIKALVSDETGSGALVFATSPTLVTPILGTASATKVNITKATVTQGTSTATTVVANAAAGVITTFTSVLAAGASVNFTVTNSQVSATSVIQLTLDDSANTSGYPVVRLNGVPGAGSFSIKVTNIHPTNALNNVLKIHFLVS